MTPHPGIVETIYRRTTALLLAFLIVAVVGFSASAQASDDPVRALPAEAQSVILAINQIRVNAGLVPLTVHPLLNQAAQAHVNDMIAHRRYGHRGSDGSTVRQRIARTGYNLAGGVGENWAAMRSPERAVQWWMSDPPHRANILNPRWREIGIGSGMHPGGWGILIVTDFTGGSTNQPPGSLPAPTTPVALDVPADGLDYVIQPGDTLIGIGVRYGIDWSLIAAANDLAADSILQIGQVIRLPGANLLQPAPQVATQQPPDNGSMATSGNAHPVRDGVAEVLTATDSIVSSPRSHTVVSGDTIIKIARRYGVGWRTLLRLNGLTESSVLQVGQTIRLP